MPDLAVLMSQLWLPILCAGGITLAIKNGKVIENRYLPLVSLVSGIVSGILLPDVSWAYGLVAGLIASGGYDIVKKTAMGK